MTPPNPEPPARATIPTLNPRPRPHPSPSPSTLAFALALILTLEEIMKEEHDARTLLVTVPKRPQRTRRPAHRAGMTAAEAYKHYSGLSGGYSNGHGHGHSPFHNGHFMPQHGGMAPAWAGAFPGYRGAGGARPRAPPWRGPGMKQAAPHLACGVKAVASPGGWLLCSDTSYERARAGGTRSRRPALSIRLSRCVNTGALTQILRARTR